MPCFLIVSDLKSKKFILTICCIIEGVRVNYLLFVDFSKAFDSTYKLELEQILLAYGLPKETAIAKMMLNKNLKAIIFSRDGNIYFLTMPFESY